MRVETDWNKFNPWLKKKKARIFSICFAWPSSTSKKKIMIRLDNKLFYTLQEIEDEIGELIFIIRE